MRTLLERYRPFFEGEGTGGGEGGADDGEGGAPAFAVPEGFPDQFRGETADETIGKLFGGYQEVHTRAEGLRTKLAQTPAAPDSPDAYTFEPSEKTKPYFGDVNNDPMFGIARKAAHEAGISQEGFSNFLEAVYGGAIEGGLLNEPYSAEKQVNSYMEAAGLDSKAASEALTNSLAFAKGLGEQLKGVPDAMKDQVSATLLDLTNTAAGNFLLQGLSARLQENGIRISGEGGQQGALTKDDLKKLDSDPRIDPRNREHPDRDKRYDEDLRKRYDAAYAHHF